MDTLAQAIQAIENRAKAEVGREFLKRSYGALSPGNANPWNRDGFYTARQPSELEAHGFAVPELERAFPVPVDCPYWGAPFTDGDQVCRAFLRHAWLPLPEGGATDVLAIPVYGATAGIYASVNGVELALMAACASDANTLLWRMGEADPHGVLHLHSDAEVVRLPQHGRVSCFVGMPYWHR